jgi:phosphoglycerate dehydrogenase-like enzyme
MVSGYLTVRTLIDPDSAPMPRFLVNQEFLDAYGPRFVALCGRYGLDLEPLTLPPEPQQRLEPALLAQIGIACFTGVFDDDVVFTRRFLGSLLHAPHLRWFHLPNAGVDDPVFGRFLERGVRLTTSSGATAEPIAHSAIGGLLALARGFPHWWAAQRRHEWAPLSRAGIVPRDLRGQVIVVVGLGAIGTEIARLSHALGLHVIGVRRRPCTSGDPVDEWHPPAALHTLLPRADWLVLACPLTADTRGLLDASALACLPARAHLINVARGQLVDEDALVAALREHRLAGAYLDVFTNEPLPAASPLWDLPGVIISPHDSSASDGNVARVSELFLRNLEHYARSEALENEVRDR